MTEVSRRESRSKLFHQEIWSSVSRRNSFEDRRLRLTHQKLDKDEMASIKAWEHQKLLLMRRKRKAGSQLSNYIHSFDNNTVGHSGSSREGTATQLLPLIPALSPQNATHSATAHGNDSTLHKSMLPYSKVINTDVSALDVGAHESSFPLQGRRQSPSSSRNTDTFYSRW